MSSDPTPQIQSKQQTAVSTINSWVESHPVLSKASKQEDLKPLPGPQPFSLSSPSPLPATPVGWILAGEGQQETPLPFNIA